MCERCTDPKFDMEALATGVGQGLHDSGLLAEMTDGPLYRLIVEFTVTDDEVEIRRQKIDVGLI